MEMKHPTSETGRALVLLLLQTKFGGEGNVPGRRTIFSKDQVEASRHGCLANARPRLSRRRILFGQFRDQQRDLSPATFGRLSGTSASTSPQTRRNSKENHDYENQPIESPHRFLRDRLVRVDEPRRMRTGTGNAF